MRYRCSETGLGRIGGMHQRRCRCSAAGANPPQAGLVALHFRSASRYSQQRALRARRHGGACRPLDDVVEIVWVYRIRGPRGRRSCARVRRGCCIPVLATPLI
jgi:hypothetical protein